MSTPGDELAPVLARISGTDLYRSNAFRVTGLPADATPSRIRRTREEALLMSRLGAPATGAAVRTAAPGGEEALRAAYETLRDPVARLVHELLWPQGQSAPAWSGAEEHERAAHTHQEAVEGEAAGPYEPGSAQAARLDGLWTRGLAGWASVLADHDFWDHARRRVAEIGDPRLTSGTVRRLRDRLPKHLASVTAELALRSAVRGRPAGAGRLVALLHSSPLPERAVADALREAVRPAESALRAACGTAREAVSAAEGDGGPAGRALLERIGDPLGVVRTVLGPDAALTSALEEEVAAALNQCAVGEFHATGRVRAPLEVLAWAAGYAHAQRTKDLIERNAEVVSHSRNASPAGPSDDLPPLLRQMCLDGRVERAAAYLRAMAGQVVNRDRELAGQLMTLATDRRSVAAPVARQPFTGRVLGCGVHALRAPGPDAEGTRWVTHVLTLFWLPLLPLAAYARDDRAVRARVPLTGRARWTRRWTLLLVPPLALFPVIGPAALPVLAALLIGYGTFLGKMRGERVRTWARQDHGRHR
ncbi:hypothetical protein [Streptomyces sp. NBC_01477]|uniref:hypothetical protein n=1 Tax=Streptomyces sp. NBC_01477 TaxID=2976015 RepID=UPI002E308183|nr:hypothetical protein [Streptomyces sp. NBC_01477]